MFEGETQNVSQWIVGQMCEEKKSQSHRVSSGLSNWRDRAAITGVRKTGRKGFSKGQDREGVLRAPRV